MTEKETLSVDTVIGLAKDIAIELVKKTHMKMFISKEDEKSFMRIMNVDNDRINVEITKGLITKAWLG